MQIIQAGPSSRTLRQNALNDSLEQVVSGFGQMDHQAKTKRAEALALNDQTMKLREAGYDVTPEMIKQSTQEAPNGIQKFFGAKDPEKVDLYGKRTAEYDAKIASAAEEKKFKRKVDEADIEYKKSQTAGNYASHQKLLAEAMDLKSGGKFKRELQQGQTKQLGEASTKIIAVKSGIDNALAQLDDPNLSDDAKLKVGQETLKLLNSAEGADAVGSEEAARIGSKLEFAMGNFFNGNKTQFGRDLPGFAEQLRNNSLRLGGRVKNNEQAMNQIMSGESLTNIAGTTPTKPLDESGNAMKNKYAPSRITATLPSGKQMPTKIAGIPTEQFSSMDAGQISQKLEELKAKKAQMGGSTASRTGSVR